MSFDRFIGIDWSGRDLSQNGHGSIQVAVCTTGRSAPELVPSATKYWTRSGVAEWLKTQCKSSSPLVGCDFSFSFPFKDCGSYFPGSMSPSSAIDLWRLVDVTCSKEREFYGVVFAKDDRWKSHFWISKAERGEHFQKNSIRRKVAEEQCVLQEKGHPETVFKLIYGKQVGRGSLAGMRVLHRLKGEVADLVIWPFDPLVEGRPTIVEAFPRLFLRAAEFPDRKIHHVEELNQVLEKLDSDVMPKGFNLEHRPGSQDADKHANDRADALVTAAGLRACQSEKNLWHPKAMTEEIRRTEGWIFGVA